MMIKICLTPLHSKTGLAECFRPYLIISAFKAKEYYLYKTLEILEHQKELRKDIRNYNEKRFDENIRKRPGERGCRRFIYNLHDKESIFNYFKRHANKRI